MATDTKKLPKVCKSNFRTALVHNRYFSSREVPPFRTNDVTDHTAGGGHTLSAVRSAPSNGVSISDPETESFSSASIDQRRVCRVENGGRENRKRRIKRTEKGTLSESRVARGRLFPHADLVNEKQTNTRAM